MERLPLDWPEPEPTSEDERWGTPETARTLAPVRNQLQFEVRTLDELLPEDHPARAIWSVVERMDLRAFFRDIRSVINHPGRPATDPRVLLSLWLFATTEGIGSARRLDRLSREHVAYRWLAGGVPVDYHVLADFRRRQESALDDLLTHMVATMLQQGLVTLERVSQDGMRVRVGAGKGSFRGAEKLAQCQELAREQVARLREEREAEDGGVESRRVRAARERAVRERAERVDAAVEQLAEVHAAKERQQQRRGKARERVGEAKASTTDPEARVMRFADGGFRPGYNLQAATDVGSQVIVAIRPTNRGTDQGEAVGMLAEVERRTGLLPERYLMDGGYVNLEQITEIERRGVAVYAPPPPAKHPKRRDPGTARPNDTSEVSRWRARMTTAEAHEIYVSRAGASECVNAQMKMRFGLDHFPLRGLHGALSVALLVAVMHNLWRWLALGG